MSETDETIHAKPRLVLLHGAGLGKWIWNRVLPKLTAPAEALDLPGRSDQRNPGDVTLSQCIDFVAGKTRPQSILVGHSLSAEVAFGAAAARPQNVAAIVLVGGMLPESGTSFMSLLPLPQRLFLHVVLRLSRSGVKLPASLTRAEYCSDLDEETTNLVLKRVTPEAPRLYLDSLHWSALPEDIPRFYVKLLDDKSVNPNQQDKIIDRIRATDVESLSTGHLPMLAQPCEMAAMLNRWVDTVSLSSKSNFPAA
jgi:pimeloyl-ACP methyl ester carboxylesterase